MDPETKTVSVVIPLGDRAPRLGIALQSLLTQGYPNLEIIVVDDGSNRVAVQTVAAIGDARVRTIRSAQPGRAAACNAGLARAGGDYVAFLAPADRYLPDKVALQVAYLEDHPDLGMVYTAATCVDALGNPSAGAPVGAATTTDEVYAEIGFRAPVQVAFSTVMVRRSVLAAVGGFDEALECFEDTDLWRRIAKAARVGAIAQATAEVCDQTDEDPDPIVVLGAYAAYAAKVEREDGDRDPLIRATGLRRLGEQAAAVLRARGRQVPFGDLLLHQAERQFDPKVSIIIPVYNGAKYLAEAIDSALAQTYSNIEIIVVNDGSTDAGASERVALAYGERIRYAAKPNGGVATALNRGVEEMTGDYFSWLSHDDLYLPDKVETQIKALLQMPDPRRCVLYSDYEVFTDDPAAGTPYILQHMAPEDFRYYITIANALHGCTLLVPRQAFAEHGGFNPALRTTQDYDLWFRMAETYAFVHQPVILVRARSHAEQGTLQMLELAMTECNALLQGFVEQLSEADVRQDASIPQAEGYFRLAGSLSDRGFKQAGRRAAQLGVQHLIQMDIDAGAGVLDQRAATEARAVELAIEAQRRLREIEQLKLEIARLSAVIADGELRRTGLQTQLENYCHELDVIYASRSWKVTGPLRYVNEQLARIRR